MTRRPSLTHATVPVIIINPPSFQRRMFGTVETEPSEITIGILTLVGFGKLYSEARLSLGLRHGP
jgi:hypothetical protein